MVVPSVRPHFCQYGVQLGVQPAGIAARKRHTQPHNLQRLVQNPVFQPVILHKLHDGDLVRGYGIHIALAQLAQDQLTLLHRE